MASLKEFLLELAEELRYLPTKEVNEILKHYRDKVNNETDYGANEEQVVASFKSPKIIAKEIYDRHGENYLKKRIQKSKVKNLFDVFISGVMIVLVLICSLGIFISLGKLMINVLTLLFSSVSFNNVIDKIISFLCVLTYFIFMLILCIFIVDLLYILISSLLRSIFKKFERTKNKKFKFLDFTISGSLNKILKKDKFIFKFFAIIACCFVVFYGTSYFTKGYAYRSIKDVNLKKEEWTIDTSFDSILIKGNNSYIIVRTSSDVEKPIINFSYELTSFNYRFDNNKLIIDIDSPKTYDIFGLLKSPTPTLELLLPINNKYLNCEIENDYGKIVLDRLNSITNDIIISGKGLTVSLNENEILGNLSIDIKKSTIITNSNYINKLIVSQESGEVTFTNDTINHFEHINKSGVVKLINDNISSYELNSHSGSVYAERVKGNEIVCKMSTAVNTFYDIYFNTGLFEISNTGSFNITRGYFKGSFTSKSSTSSYQTISYVTSPLINLNGNTGQIIIEKSNAIYSVTEIENFDDDYKKYIEEYNQLIKSNDISTKMIIESNKTNISLIDIAMEKLECTISSASFAVANMIVNETVFIFYDVGAEIDEYYGNMIDLTMESSSISNQTVVNISNKNQSDLVIKCKKDGISILTSENIQVNQME